MPLFSWWITWAGVQLLLGAAGPVDGLPSRLEALATCRGDAFEPNDERSRARPLDGEEVRASACAFDDDWYRFPVAKGQRVRVRLQHAPQVVFEKLRVYAPRARKPAGRLTRAPGLAEVRFQARRAGNHRVRVRTSAGGATYRLQVVYEDDAQAARQARGP